MLWNRHIIRPSRISGLIKREAMEVWLCSFGGCGTNMLADYLTSKQMALKTPVWHQLLCHHATPIHVQSPVKAIYLFGNPILSLRSMKHRQGLGEVNLAKLNNHTRLTYSDEALFRSMLNQFENWTRPNSTNLDILVVRFEDIFESGKHAIADFLKLDVSDFPSPRSRTATSAEAALPCEAELTGRYLGQLKHIANFAAFRHLPPHSERTDVDSSEKPLAA